MRPPHLPGVPKVDDKNEDISVKSVCESKEASRKWTRTRKPNTKWQDGLP